MRQLKQETKMIHFKDYTEDWLKQINERCKIQFQDDSSPFDLCDIAINAKHDINIMFPNNSIHSPERDEYATFAISNKGHFQELTDDIEQVIQYINKISHE